ncbi:NADH-quinone oxidoreductase subunit H [candidate division KSB1 bacterium]|nr:NADH-quinone oxidoreductase subunit H [candidate division KSB1 bacterium]
MAKTIGLSILNVVVIILLAPLFEGIMRKLKAYVHSRIGPPIIQPYYDILKLLGKEEIKSSDNFFFKYAAVLSFTVIILLTLLTPLGSSAPPFDMFGEVIVFVYLISLVAVFIILGGLGTGSPFATVGAGREMMLVITVEPVIAIALITMGVKAGSMRFSDIMQYSSTHGFSISMLIVSITLFLATISQLAKLPFDIVEADQEIMEGPFIEQSGPKLALFKWGYYAKGLIFASIFISVFIPWPVISFQPLAILVHFVKMLIMLIVVAVVDVVNPRLRIDQAIRYFGLIIFVAITGLAFAIIGV